jgi:hypothetical protein
LKAVLTAGNLIIIIVVGGVIKKQNRFTSLFLAGMPMLLRNWHQPMRQACLFNVPTTQRSVTHSSFNVCVSTIKKYTSLSISHTNNKPLLLTPVFRAWQLKLSVSQPPSSANPAPARATAAAVVHCRAPHSLYVAPPLDNNVCCCCCCFCVLSFLNNVFSTI